MKTQLLKTLNFIIVSTVVVSLAIAPTLQAVQISETVTDLQQKCRCSCCKDLIQEKTCAAKTFSNDDNCGCRVGQSMPINSVPIVSNHSQENLNQTAVENCYETGSLVVNSYSNHQFIEIDYLPQKHPPLFILNSSLLI